MVAAVLDRRYRLSFLGLALCSCLKDHYRHDEKIVHSPFTSSLLFAGCPGATKSNCNCFAGFGFARAYIHYYLLRHLSQRSLENGWLVAREDGSRQPRGWCVDLVESHPRA